MEELSVNKNECGDSTIYNIVDLVDRDKIGYSLRVKYHTKPTTVIRSNGGGDRLTD